MVLIRSLKQWSSLFVGINASHTNSAVISYSLSVKCIIPGVNLGDVIEVLDIRLRPSDRYLRRSVYIICLPSVQYGGVFAAFLYSFLHPWLCDDLFAKDCDHFSFLLK